MQPWLHLNCSTWTPNHKLLKERYCRFGIGSLGFEDGAFWRPASGGQQQSQSVEVRHRSYSSKLLKGRLERGLYRELLSGLSKGILGV